MRAFRKTILLFCLMAVLFALPALAGSVKVPASITLYDGQTVSLIKDFDEGTSFSSSNSNIVLVNEEGILTGIKSGQAKVTVRQEDSTAQCAVTVKKTTLKIRASSTSLYEGKTLALTAALSPASSSLPVTWKSSQTSVATVDENGVVTGQKPGYVTITAKLSNGSTASVILTVKKNTVKLNKSSASVYEGKSFTLAASPVPASGKYTQVSWYSSNSKVASVDENGVVTGKKAGSATITAKLANGSSAYCTVTVKKTTLAINRSSVTIYEGKTAALLATITPSGGLYNEVTYSSSNARVASVDENGVISGKAYGAATITARLGNGAQAKCIVTVKKNTVSLNVAKKSVYQGQSFALLPTVSPAEARYSQADVIYVSSNKKVATVDAQGVVTAHAKGVASITAKLPNGSQAVCAVTVKEATIRFDAASGAAYLGYDYPLQPKVTPSEGLYSLVTYSSSNPQVISVDSAGRVRGLQNGSAVITARLATGAKATIRLTVRLPEVRLSASSLTLYLDSQATISAAQFPASAEEIVFDVASSDPSVAQVTSDGKVIPRGIGKTTVTFTHPNGNSATCKIEVRDYEVYSVTLDAAQLTVEQGKTAQLTATVLHALAANKTVSWSSSNPSVARISSDGVVSGLKGGKCTITATSANGKKASCAVTVDAPKYRALVMGEFLTSGMYKELLFGTQSVSAASAALRARNYSVSSIYTPLSRPQMLSRISSFGQAADDNDVTLIYITTHGVDHEGKFYLALNGWYESNDTALFALSSQDLISAISSIRGHVVLCLNACNSGGFIREVGAKLSEMNVTVICSSAWGVSSGWYRKDSIFRDFMTWGFTRAMGYNMPTGGQIKLYADKNGDGVLTAQEVANYTAYYTALLARQYFGTANFVGDTVPQEPVILVTHPDQPLYGD